MKPTSLLAALPLAACMTLTPADARVVTYACDDGPDLTVVYSGNRARIDHPGGAPTDLRRMERGSGVLYSSADRKIRGEGDVITYEVGRSAPLTCRAKEAEAS